MKLNPAQKEGLGQKLLEWYDKNRRDLPWRQTRDPYSIWISEVMLQQTQVQTVIPYYLRFLKAFPGVQKLARAESQELLRVCAGLGYYSRVYNLQKAAKTIVNRHRGKFPETYEEVLSLPGIGRYTAGALMSIAFGKPYPALDGNTSRVLARLFMLRGNPKKAPLQNLLWDIARALISNQRPGDFNQALMELGATLCLPFQPRCSSCPWKFDCLARREGTQDLFPERTKLPRAQNSLQAAAVISDGKRILIVKRNNTTRLKDFWEFPGGEFNASQDLETDLVNTVRDQFGLHIQLSGHLATIRHAITNTRITLQVFSGRVKRPPARHTHSNRNARWVHWREIGRFPFASASLQILQILKKRELKN